MWKVWSKGRRERRREEGLCGSVIGGSTSRTHVHVHVHIHVHVYAHVVHVHCINVCTCTLYKCLYMYMYMYIQCIMALPPCSHVLMTFTPVIPSDFSNNSC